MNSDDLTPGEREAFAALPREEPPPPELEERTVAALRARGLLGRGGGRVRRGLRLPTGGLALAATAACLAVIGAFALGQDLGARRTREAMLAMHAQDGARETASVQETSAAYVAALADLVRASAERPHTEEREAAVHSLYRVADQMVRLAPDDPLATHILQALDQAETAPAGATGGDDDQIIWF